MALTISNVPAVLVVNIDAPIADPRVCGGLSGPGAVMLRGTALGKFEAFLAKGKVRVAKYEFAGITVAVLSHYEFKTVPSLKYDNLCRVFRADKPPRQPKSSKPVTLAELRSIEHPTRLSYKRQFHNKTKTKTKLISKDGSFMVDLPYGLYSAKTGKPTYGDTSLGGQAMSFRKDCDRKLMRKLRVRASVDFKKRSKVNLVTRKPEPIQRKKVKGPTFTPASKVWGDESAPASSDSETPGGVIGTRTRSLSLNRYLTSKRFSLSQDGLVVTTDDVGARVVLDCPLSKLEEVCMPYFSAYTPYSHDFVSGLSLYESNRVGHHFDFKLVKNTVQVISTETGELKTSFMANSWYRAVHSLKVEKHVPARLLNLETGGEGFCYLGHVWYLSLLAGVQYNNARNYFVGKLGSFPRADVLKRAVSDYFGPNASYVDLTGFYTGKNQFHCSNDSTRRYSFKYLRNAKVGALRVDPSPVIRFGRLDFPAPPSVTVSTVGPQVGAVPPRLKLAIPREYLRRAFMVNHQGEAIPRNRLGWHLHCPTGVSGLPAAVRDYLRGYNALRDDFITSVSVNEEGLGLSSFQFRLVGREIKIYKANRNRVVETVTPSEDYLSVYRSVVDRKLPQFFYSRVNKGRGLCYLNHLWFICYITNSSFVRASAVFVKALALFPTSCHFKNLLAQYFGDLSVTIPIAGYKVSRRIFHCSNEESSTTSLELLCSRRVSIGGNEIEPSSSTLTGVDKEKLIQKIVDTARGHKDSILVKKVELDLVDYAAKMRDLQKEKKSKRVPFCLSESQQTTITRDYPEFDLVFTNSRHSDHPMAASSRLLENIYLASLCGDEFSDIGGCPLHHYNHNPERRVHVCRPVFDSKDAQRRIIRNSQFKHARLGNPTEGMFKASSNHTACSRVAIECSHKSPYLICVQVYDLDLVELCRAMINKCADVSYLSMITPGEILDRREAFRHDILGCEIGLDQHMDSIVYKFGSSCYTHRLSTILAYMTTPVIVVDKFLFSVEMIEVRCGVNIYVVTKSEVCPQMNFDKFLRYKRCCSDLVRVKLPRFCKKTRRCLPGVEYIYVDRKFVERVHDYVVGNCSVVNSKTFEWTWNFVKSSRSRVVISGKIIHRDVSISIDHIEQFVVVMLAAGVRTRLTSEYLAKNISIFCGDTGLWDVLKFSLREKYCDLKRSVSKAMMSSVKTFFADSLLLEFLDLDDCLDEVGEYSEVTVPVRVSGFGTIPDNEAEVMIVERSKQDLINSAIFRSTKELYKPPGAPRDDQYLHQDGRGGTEHPGDSTKPSVGVMGRSPPGFEQPMRQSFKGGLKGGQRVGVIERLLVHLGISPFQASLESLNIIQRLAQSVTGKVGGVLKFISFITLALRDSVSLLGRSNVMLSFYNAAVDVGQYMFSKGSTLTGALERFLTAHVMKYTRNLGEVIEVLITVVSRISVASQRFSETTIAMVSKYLQALKSWSFIDFSSSLPFEVTITLVKRFIYDFKAILLGQMSLAKFTTKFLLNVLYELNLNYLLSACLGVPSTIKKEFFIRAVSEFVSSGLIDGMDGSLGGLIRVSAFVPIFVRKLLVSFFDDDFNEYVPIAKYALSETNVVDYLTLCYRNGIQGYVGDIQERFANYLSKKLDEVVELGVASLVANCKLATGYTSLVTATDRSAEAVRNSVMRVKKAFSNSKIYFTSLRAPVDSDDEYESADEDDHSDIPGLRGGSVSSVLSGKVAIHARRAWHFVRSLFRYLSGFICNSKFMPSIFNFFYYSSKFAQIESNLAVTRLVGHETTDSAWMCVYPDFLNFMIRANSCFSGFGSFVKELMLALELRRHSPTFYYYDVPYYALNIILAFSNPALAVFNITSLLLDTYFSPSFAGALVVDSSMPMPSEVVLTELASNLAIEPSEDFYTDFLDELSSSLATDLSDTPGLRGGSTISVLGAIINLLVKFGSFKPVRWIFKVILKFFSSSLLSASLSANNAPMLTRVICFVSSLLLKGNVSVCLLSRLSSMKFLNPKLSSVLNCVCKLEKSLRLYLQGPCSVEDLRRIRKPVFGKVPVGAKVPLGVPVGTIVQSKEAYFELESELGEIVENSKDDISAYSGSEDSDSTHTSSEESESSLLNEGDRANLVPEMTAEVSYRNECSTRPPIPKQKQGKRNLCKFLKLQNEISTVPVPYVAVTKDDFSGCTNAMREFYFMQTVNIFSIHSKLQLYFEELERCDFDRRISSCNTDKALYVYNASKGSVTDHFGRVFALSKFNDHEMAYTKFGLAENEPSVKVNKLFHDQTKFLGSNSLLRSCESHASAKFTNMNIDIRLYEAPPGGGKTTMLINLYKQFRKTCKIIIVTANKNSQEDILGKLKSSIEYGCGYSNSGLHREVLTMDSYLINHFGSKCDVLFVDECFMVHAGQVIAILNYTGCKKAVLFGDSKQIHYIERDELVQSLFHDIDGFIEPECRYYGNISFRCPWDVCAWLSEHYGHCISTTQGESVGKVSTQIINIESIEDVPFASRVKYVTYTQAEKHELQKRLSKTYSEVQVNTVHEVQGETFPAVYLVRTKYQEDAPFVSDNHIVVALSRHVYSLSYFVISSRCHDATATAIRKMEEIAEAYKIYPHRYEFSYISLSVTNAPTDISRCKALSAPYDSINAFLNDVVRGSTSVNFGDVSAEMSSMPFESGVDGVTIADSREEKVPNDHDPQRV